MWTAIYHDGTYLQQFVDGVEKLYNDIDLARLYKFRVEEYSHVIEIDLTTGLFYIDGNIFRFFEFEGAISYDLIYFRRNIVKIRMMGSGAIPRKIYHCIGCKSNIAGKSVNKIAIISPDRSIIFSDK